MCASSLNFKHPKWKPLQKIIGALRKSPNTVKLASKPRCDFARTRLSSRIFPATNERSTPYKMTNDRASKPERSSDAAFDTSFKIYFYLQDSLKN